MQDFNEGDAPSDWGNEESAFYSLRLFVTGTSSVSMRAINNIKKLCDQHLAGKYELEIIDVYQQPLLVQNENITAVPMLVQKQPLPKRRLVGDMSDEDKIIKWLGLI